MAIHQADLQGSKKDQDRIDREAMEQYLTDDVDLAKGLGVTDEVLDGLRRQALALYEGGKWQRCIDVVLGLAALGSVHPADPLMLSRCYRELGMEQAAYACASHANRLLSAMGVEIEAVEEETR